MKMAQTSLGPLKATICLFLIAISFSFANSARLLDEVDQQDPSLVPPTTTLPSGQFPATTPVPATTDEPPADPDTEQPPVANVAMPDAPTTVATTPTPVPAGPATVATTPIPVPAGPATSLATGATSANTAGPQATASSTTPQLSFYMHDILGGTHPSARVVTGIIARSDINGIPFSQPNNNIFPLQGGVPLTNINNLNSLLNPSTVPFITGLNGGRQSTTVLQNANNNAVNGGNRNNQPFVTAGQLPAGSALQKLMFGSITVVDDELTEGEELGSGVMGRAQGFYLACSLDGTSHTVALTLLLQEGSGGNGTVGDSISLFGVHREAAGASHVAVVGGTGRYEGAGGYATVETILHQEDQHTTDGVDTMMHIAVYLS